MERYQVISDIGKGSYGVVQKIKRINNNEEPEKKYCWKEINYGHLSEKERAQIVSEINCLSKLNHPNIVKYVEKIVQRDDKKIYIVMEFCENGDMAQLIKKCKAEKDFVAEDVIWKIFMQILLALRECHYRGIKGSKILHRDLKPSNVFFDSNNNVKLGDFGLSRIISCESEDMREHFASTNVGTPYYMSPEQINESQYDEKTDIWSMGCVIYELVSLLPPFTAGNHLALAQKILAGKVDRIPERYSEDLQEVIQWMLNIDPTKRPSVEDLIKLPKIKLRINERKMRDQYAKLKYKESKLDKRESEMKTKQQELEKREKMLKEKKQRVLELYNKQKLKAMQKSVQQSSEKQFNIQNVQRSQKMNMNELSYREQKVDILKSHESLRDQIRQMKQNFSNNVPPADQSMSSLHKFRQNHVIQNSSSATKSNRGSAQKYHDKQFFENTSESKELYTLRNRINSFHQK